MFKNLVMLIALVGAASAKAVPAKNGDGTYYSTGLGACGIVNRNSDYIVAVSAQLFDTYPGNTPNPNNNPICHKQLTAHYKGKSVTVTVTDRCAGCNGVYDLDLSPSAFSVLADKSLGRIPITWNWN